MKLLYDCFSCSPYYGSDEGIGWLWPYHMRQRHEVWVLVRADRKEDIEKYCQEHGIDNIHFIYADIPQWLNFYYRNKKRGKNGTLDFLAYQFLWQFPAYRAAKKAHKHVHFDLVHHASTNDFRFLGQMHRLNIPYVIGPVGGAQQTPDALKRYTACHKHSEMLRTALNYILTRLPGYRSALQKAERIFFSNRETEAFLRPLIADRQKCEIMTEVAYSGEVQFDKLKHRPVSEGCTFLWAGRMEYRKGLELLFDALEELPLDAAWKLVLCGDGSEMERYRRLVSQKPYAGRVVFSGRLAYHEMGQMYDAADVFVFPSLRETTGTVIIEAMAHGLPVIALKQGGAVQVVAEGTGTLVSASDREGYVRELSKAMERYIFEKEKRREHGLNAAQRIQAGYTWQSKTQYMDRVYQQLLQRRTQGREE